MKNRMQKDCYRTTLNGTIQKIGRVFVNSGDKPPKRRFEPGQFLKYQGQLYEIMYCYRVQENTRDWIYYLEERQSLQDGPRNELIAMLETTLGCGETTPRISYEVFKNSWDAFTFFGDIPRNGNGVCMSNTRLMKDVELISSGKVL